MRRRSSSPCRRGRRGGGAGGGCRRGRQPARDGLQRRHRRAIHQHRRRPGARARQQPARPRTAKLAPKNTDKGKGPFAGDVAIYALTLYSDRALKKRRGSAVYTCYFNYDQHALCKAYFKLGGGNTLVASGPIDFKNSKFTIVVTGGTNDVSRCPRRGQGRRRAEQLEGRFQVARMSRTTFRLAPARGNRAARDGARSAGRVGPSQASQKLDGLRRSGDGAVHESRRRPAPRDEHQPLQAQVGRRDHRCGTGRRRDMAPSRATTSSTASRSSPMPSARSRSGRRCSLATTRSHKRATCDSYFDLSRRRRARLRAGAVRPSPNSHSAVTGGTRAYFGALGEVGSSPAAGNAERFDLRMTGLPK